MNQALFVTIALFGLFAALGTVLARNLVHAALYLVAFFFLVACVFVILDAEFLAAIQVLVYIGAVSILLMFGIMLTRNVQGDQTTSVPRGWVYPALGATLGLFFFLAFGINNSVSLGLKKGPPRNVTVKIPDAEPPREAPAWVSMTRRPSARGSTINDMGRVVGVEMVTRYAVAFEVAGLLLTAALVGAVALAHREADDDRAGRPAPVTSARNGTDENGTALAGASRTSTPL